MLRVAKLSASHSSISSSPEIITDSAPHTINTDLNSSFILVGSSTQPDVTSFTLFLAFNTGIISMSAGANIEEAITSTVQNARLISSADKVVESNWTSTLSKSCIGVCHGTYRRVNKL